MEWHVFDRRKHHYVFKSNYPLLWWDNTIGMMPVSINLYLGLN